MPMNAPVVDERMQLWPGISEISALQDVHEEILEIRGIFRADANCTLVHQSFVKIDLPTGRNNIFIFYELTGIHFVYLAN